jgi:hypothetical protein
MPRAASTALMIPLGLVWPRRLDSVPSGIGTGAIVVVLFFIILSFVSGGLIEDIHHGTTERI